MKSMEIRWDGTRYHAAVCFEVLEDGDPHGTWTLRLYDGNDDGEVSVPVLTWPGRANPPPLLERYDALATFGFAVAEGGAQAWQWRETLDPDTGNMILMGITEIRPMRESEIQSAQSLNITP